MPLSEREQRMLEELEAQLRAEDPRLATHLRDTRPAGVSVRRIVLGVALAVAGLAVVLWGVAVKLVAVGVGGAVLIGAGLYIVTTRDRTAASRDAGADGRSAAGGTRREGAFMARLERQWDERRRQER